MRIAREKRKQFPIGRVIQETTDYSQTGGQKEASQSTWNLAGGRGTAHKGTATTQSKLRSWGRRSDPPFPTAQPTPPMHMSLCLTLTGPASSSQWECPRGSAKNPNQLGELTIAKLQKHAPVTTRRQNATLQHYQITPYKDCTLQSLPSVPWLA